jgi:hypothetical protein
MIFEVEGKFWTDWESYQITVEELRALGSQVALNEHYFHTFDGGDAYVSKIQDVELVGTPFANTLESCEEWDQIDEDGEPSISNESDGFAFADFDFASLSGKLDDEIVELDLRFYSGFRISVIAESQEEATSIVNELGPNYFFVQDSSENEWEIKEVEIEYVAELE